MRFCFFILLFLYPALLLNAQNKTPILERAKAQALYKEAKAEFVRFEKEHGAFIQTKNVRMHYLTWGSPSGTPFIWSHGSLTNGYELFDVAPSLVKAGYYVIAIDYYGHGQTTIPTHEVSLYHIADDLKELMDKLKIKKAIIGGWSRGGYISTAFYDAYPDRVLGLVLEDGGSVNMNTYYHQMDPEKLGSTLQKIEKDWPADTSYASEFEAYYANYDTSTNGNQFNLLAWITKNNKGRWAISPGVIDLFHMRSARQWSDNILHFTRVPLFAESMSILEPKIVYRNLNVPLLILDPISKDDFMPFEAENSSLQKQHPNYITHNIYKDTGHNIHYERPKQFIQDLTVFLGKVKTHNQLK
ncbi:alpha/beta fold hydrolase [Adhaeribacter radiodurans]|uniref:Alpha/beta hydrolase n=1 Tax=Adhaeribacter radiodurans TaxID=2745197 RepID=A0A7L7LDV3_9BACT|nr:alpha/beta hydrolase [Adhaeribacter radiodurans]QMU30937.1 alpha/beta hydrolase [Adhaeribacter radiodurans]